MTASVVVAIGALCFTCNRARAVLPAITMSVGPDESLVYPSNLPSLPDEHTTIFPPAPGSNTYRFFASSSLTGGFSGTVVLETTDLQNFAFAAGYSSQVMSVPVRFTTCNPTFDTEFDENYAGAGSVVQDPTRPPGNLIMIYEAENHCPGGVWQQPFYATVGFARSSDNGKTWPAPVNAEFGGADRYPVLKLPAPEPASEPSPAAMGNAIPSAIVDGNYLYVTYVAPQGPGANSDGKLRIARALLGGNGTIAFSKWNNGAFSTPGIGGNDTGFLPQGGCVGSQAMPSIYHLDALGIYLLTFVCRSLPQAQGAWYFSVATSLDLQDWTVPQLARNSQFPLIDPCPGQTDNGMSFDGWYPSLMSPGASSGHIAQAGYAFFLNGCDTGKRSFMRRAFAITIGASAPTIDQHGLTGSWYRAATSGQGMEIEVFPDLVASGVGFLQGSCFTFADTNSGAADRNRWYTFSGNVRAGDAAAVLTLYQNVGGSFNAPPVTSSVEVGQVAMSFTDCTTAQLNYTFTDGSGRNGNVSLTRLTPNVSCAAGGSANASADFGLSGNWYDPARSGQGFVVELNPLAKVLFFAWYTYTVNGQPTGAAGQRWYTGQANYTPGARSIALSLYETTGGLFDSIAPTPTTVQVGTGTLTFASCSAATLDFNFTGGSATGRSGTITLARVGPTPAACSF
ncbi:MAG TPA: hypothetical protein VMV45_08395 [Casimicrobiaceae bacterium]|nr:hypothetical protein [Casimicrobiaceae bacterium]